MITCCPDCGVAEFETDTQHCAYCAGAAASATAPAPGAGDPMPVPVTGDPSPSVDAHPIHKANIDQASALIATAVTRSELEALLAAEQAHPKKARSTVLTLIQKRLDAAIAAEAE